MADRSELRAAVTVYVPTGTSPDWLARMIDSMCRMNGVRAAIEVLPTPTDQPPSEPTCCDDPSVAFWPTGDFDGVEAACENCDTPYSTTPTDQPPRGDEPKVCECGDPRCDGKGQLRPQLFPSTPNEVNDGK